MWGMMGEQAKYLIEEVGIPKEKIGVVVEKCPKIVGCRCPQAATGPRDF